MVDVHFVRPHAILGHDETSCTSIVKDEVQEVGRKRGAISGACMQGIYFNN